jgi:putative inorganic carbon (hco3(-)) transporter
VTALRTVLRPAEIVRRFALATALCAAALAVFGLGAGLTAFAGLFGDKSPGVLLGLALGPPLAIAVLAVPVLGPLVVFATFPVGSATVPTPLVELQSVEFAVLLVAGLVFLARVSRRATHAPWSPSLWWAAALTAWTLILVPSAIDTGLATKQLASLIGGLLFAVVLLAACEDMTDARRVLGGLVGVAVVIAAVGLSSGVHFQASGSASAVSGRLAGTFDQPNQLGAFCAMVAPIAAGLLLGARTRLARGAATFALFGVLVALLLSLSRGGWIGAFAGFLYLLVALPQARRLLLAISLPLALAVALAWSSASSIPEVTVVGARARALTTLSPYDGREDIYREAWREILDEPVTGQGPAGFEVASARAESESATVHADHAHNLLLTWAAETGFPGALLVLGFAAALALAGRRAGRLARSRGDPRDQAIVAGVAAGLLAVFVQGAVDYPLRNAVVWITVWTLIGVLLVCRREGAGRASLR